MRTRRTQHRLEGGRPPYVFGPELAPFHAALDRRVESWRPEPLPLLMFHGEPGDGKTEILQCIEQECAARGVPCARVSFGDLRSLSGEDLTLQALGRLAKDFGGHDRIPFPTFERAAAQAHAADRTTNLLKLGVAVAGSLSGLTALLTKDALLATAIGTAVSAGATVAGHYLSVGGEHAGHAGGDSRGRTAEQIARDATTARATLTAQLVSTFAQDLAAGAMERAPSDAARQRAAQAVVLFDAHDALLRADGMDSGGRFEDAWLRALCRDLLGSQTLVVMTGRAPLPEAGWLAQPGAAEAFPIAEVRLSGLPTAEARAYLRNAFQTRFPRWSPDEAGALFERMLDLTCEDDDALPSGPASPGTHNRFLLFLCAQMIADVRGAFRNASEVIEQLGRRLADLPDDAEVAPRLVEMYLARLPEGAAARLARLALTPSFDRDYAAALERAFPAFPDAPRSDEDHEDAEAAAWQSLASLPTLRARRYRSGKDGKEVAEFLEMPAMMREVLARSVEPSLARDIHRWAFDYWLTDAADQAFGSSYRFEDPRWQVRVDHAFHHLYAEDELVGSRTAALLFARHFLDVYWWWGENLPYAFLEAMLGDAEAILSRRQTRLAPADLGRFQQAITLLRAFTEAWPKGWYRDPATWPEAAQRFGAATVAGWSWPVVQSAMEGLRQQLCPSGATAPAAPPVGERLDEGHIAAMAGYYIGYAHLYAAAGAAAAERGERLASARQAFEEFELWFGAVEKDALKWAWARASLAEVAAATGDPAQAQNCAAEALGRLNAVGAEELGTAMECAGDAHMAVADASVAAGDAARAGGEMGRALVYARGFRAHDADDYAHSYYAHARFEARGEIERLAQADASAARAYVEGIRGVWQDAAQGNAASADPLAEFDALVPDRAKPPTRAEADETLRWFVERTAKMASAGEPLNRRWIADG